MNDRKKWRHWLAINGATVALSRLPFPASVRVSPTPENLIGFTTPEAAAEAQRVCLDEPMPVVSQLMRKLHREATIVMRGRKGKDRVSQDRGEDAPLLIVNEQPEPHPGGLTIWSCSPAKGDQG
jgi:hypothetical protein